MTPDQQRRKTERRLARQGEPENVRKMMLELFRRRDAGEISEHQFHLDAEHQLKLLSISADIRGTYGS
jgi:hypothetical protein